MPPRKDSEAADIARRKVNEKSKQKKGKGGGDSRTQYVIWVGIAVGSIAVACLLMVVNPDRGPFQTPVNDPNLIHQINRNAKSWRADKNSFFQDWTIGDVKLLEGVKLSGAPPCPLSEIDVPDAFDLREKYNMCFQMSLFNMGNCTGSWAIATASSLSDRFCMSNPTEHKDVFLSPQNLLSCDTMQQGCSGGDIASAWMFVQREGLVSELCFPWQADGSVSCSEKCTGEVPMKAASHCIVQVEDPNLRELAIRREIFANGPVVAMIWLYDDFLVYRQGLYQPMPTSTPIRDSRTQQPIMHAVKIIGWGREKKQRYWIIENSWGEDWGENGLAKVLSGDLSKREGILIEEWIVAGTPAHATEEAPDIDAPSDDLEDPDFAEDDIDVDLDDAERDGQD